MKIGELRAILSEYPDDMTIDAAIQIGYGLDSLYVEKRDILDYETKEFQQTILSIHGRSYGKPSGFPHLTERERAKRRFEILDALEDAHRHDKWASRQFTAIHGDYRIYHAHGGGNDTCYGISYDPRLFRQLEAEGLIGKLLCGPFGDYTYAITSDGRAALKILSAAA